METTGDGKHRVVVRRRMPAPRELVYQAWTDPEGLKEWMCPGDVISAEATLDVRVGGSFRIIMRRKDAVHEHVGTYRIVEPGEKLSFTWMGVDNPNEITLVTVEFLDQGEDCELVITHERFSRADLAQRYEMGWGTIARKFAEHLARLRHAGSNSSHERDNSMHDENRNKQVIRDFTRIFKNEHNVDAVDHLFDTTNFVHHFRAPVSDGFEGLKQIGRMMNGAFPDVVVREEDMVSSGDRVIERSSATATHKGSMMGERPTNKRVAWSEIHIYRLRNCKVVEHWAEMSTMELLQQIGVLPQLASSTNTSN